MLPAHGGSPDLQQKAIGVADEINAYAVYRYCQHKASPSIEATHYSS
jgi:hypothetical protein